MHTHVCIASIVTIDFYALYAAINSQLLSSTTEASGDIVLVSTTLICV